MSSFICCPSCGAQIEIAAREVQAELPGLIFECANKLDENSAPSLQSSDSTIRIDLSGKDFEEIESIRAAVGEYEWELNSKLWRCYFQSCPDALRYAVRKWNMLTEIQRRSVKHPPAWLTDRYKRARNQMMKEEVSHEDREGTQRNTKERSVSTW